ncbi:MAG TPA: MoxR family ATPase [Candidatus Acidoferrales bacterium]|nr:MoxR family ATPase [Candidatus Acidoferrales bacterium]
MRAELEPLIRNIELVIRGKEHAVRMAVVCLLARGHLLIEDVPGVGKSSLASALASSLNCSFQRIQLTSDLLPADLLGTMVYNPQTQEFQLKSGPIFHHVVLVDEINRTTPRTQSALLEAMNEGQVTLDSHTYRLPEPFMVLATQNPVEFAGTFPLPESQLDRFLMRLSLGYPGREAEREVIKGTVLPGALKPVMKAQDILSMQRRVEQVRVDEALVSYILDIVAATRSSPAIALGASPRAARALYRAAQAFAFLEGYDYVLPRHVKELCGAVLAHRIVLAEAAAGGAVSARRAEEITCALVDEVPVPL